jgi:hypothetical protein
MSRRFLLTSHVPASPPVEVTATRSSLLEFVLRFSLHRMHIIDISQINRPDFVCLDILLRVPLHQFILCSTSGEPSILICRLLSILQSIVCNVPSRRACLVVHCFPSSFVLSTNRIQVPFLLPEDYQSDIRSSFANRHIAPS